ncbi:GDSL Lipase/Acylhydrolase family protein [Ascobolus immersus RN42]|uniref:GDSL Lipase/Acylhydrolase family protein n=1 Tax=Ascobolus immersus RN42 TaxID=1160509 RepID=A0A3N4IQG1_ASCIM|nr:GDSL Lipase/Acylhydrolase family protein [Ascobolus immersus RN42]
MASNPTTNPQYRDYDKIYLLGDSITERSFDQTRGFGSGAQLLHSYARRLDVLNRGFSGYNTAHALRILPEIIPSPDVYKIKLLVVFYGANDAVLPDQPQHVALDEYKQNLKKIIHHPLIQAHQPNIILIVPPPISEYATQESDALKGIKVVQRIAENTKLYADGALEVANELKIPTVNLWAEFMAFAGWNGDLSAPLPGSKKIARDTKLEELFCDGLHFNPAGYEILYRCLMKLIENQFPELLPESLPMVHPHFSIAPR